MEHVDLSSLHYGHWWFPITQNTIRIYLFNIVDKDCFQKLINYYLTRIQISLTRIHEVRIIFQEQITGIDTVKKVNKRPILSSFPNN